MSRWRSPDGDRFRARDYDSDYDSSDEDDDRFDRVVSGRGRGRRRRSDYRVEMDDDECSLIIRRMREEDEGPWECEMEDDRGDEEMRSGWKRQI